LEVVGAEELAPLAQVELRRESHLASQFAYPDLLPRVADCLPQDRYRWKWKWSWAWLGGAACWDVALPMA
jgi:hypothetical protein